MKEQVRHRFGDKIRKIRERKGITLKAVATQVGVSESLISQIERNKVSPSVDTLISIAEALKIDLEYLFRDYKQQTNLDIIRPENRATHKKDGIVYEQLSIISENDDHAMEAFMLTIAPDNAKEDTDFGHKGRELGLILEGSAEFSYGGQSYKLKSGDCINFLSDIPHALKNTGPGPIKAVWIVTPPRLFTGARKNT